MNLGKETIEWLYHEQLMVDPEWSVRTEKGFRWWADKNAQTIEIIGEETRPDGEPGYLVSVRTEFLRDLDLTDESLVKINKHLMDASAMSGPVYDAESRTLSLCSLVMVYRPTSAVIKPLISVSAAMQIYEAKRMGAEMAKLLNAKEHISGHPEQGVRWMPNATVYVAECLTAPFAQMPCNWPESEFQDVFDKYMQDPPSFEARSDGRRLSAAFPFGDQRSLCGVTEGKHPLYGNGLQLLQVFPANGRSHAEGIRRALSLNGTELGERPSGYGFGSYYYADNMLFFMCFLPNAIYEPGFLPFLYISSVLRAHKMALMLTGQDWE